MQPFKVPVESPFVVKCTINLKSDSFKREMQETITLFELMWLIYFPFSWQKQTQNKLPKETYLNKVTIKSISIKWKMNHPHTLMLIGKQRK